VTRVLAVEDSPTQAEELRFILASEGFDVTVARDAEQGLERLAHGSYDLVVSDIMMPGLSGYDLCRLIKQDPRTRATPVILLTTLNDPMDIIQGLESGADNFITKPYDATYLLGRIHTMLTHRRMRAEGARAGGVEIFFLGKRFVISSDKEQILDLLISTFEDIVRTNRELQQSQQALAVANNELEAFSYSVSHDLRAPLRSISGFSQALVEDEADRLDERGHDYLERIRAATLRMSQLIDDLLALARVSRADLQRTNARLGEIARSCADVLSASDPARKVSWSIPADLRGQADPRLVKIAFENLLGNAWKFTRKQPEARIEVGLRMAGDERIYFVRDNGAGFDMAKADKLFAPFQRLHANAEFEGTGVGLATVQRVIHRHGGRIWAESAVGQGATFFFTLGETGAHSDRPPQSSAAV
jgi:two-component system sensor histidine kinase/response regulator